MDKLIIVYLCNGKLHSYTSSEYENEHIQTGVTHIHMDKFHKHNAEKKMAIFIGIGYFIDIEH